MQKKHKFLSPYIMDENHFKDYEYEFDYQIIHREKDIDYFCGMVSSALAELTVFQDDESWLYFLAVLSQSKILIPVLVSPAGINYKHIIKLPDCKNNYNLYLKNANVEPHIVEDNNTRFFGVFLSVREISKIAQTNTFLYIDFETVYKWIKRHRKKIDVVVIDVFSKYDYSLYMKTQDFIKRIGRFMKIAKSYTGKNLSGDLYDICLQKHKPK